MKKTIKKALNIEIPDFLVQIYENYPFKKGSCADELYLPNDLESIILNNDVDRRENIIQRKDIFIIGDDGSEETYFIDTQAAGSKVYKYDIETDKTELLTENFDLYIDYIRTVQAEIDEDEKWMAKKIKKKKWWQFWL